MKLLSVATLTEAHCRHFDCHGKQITVKVDQSEGLDLLIKNMTITSECLCRNIKRNSEEYSSEYSEEYSGPVRITKQWMELSAQADSVTTKDSPIPIITQYQPVISTH